MRRSSDRKSVSNRGRPWAVLLILALVVAACGGGNGAETTSTNQDTGTTAGSGEMSDDVVSIMLPFGESMSFHETLIADELGYFEDEGLTVEINTSDGGSIALQQVISGNQDMAFTSPGLVLTAAAEGNQVVSVGTRIQKNLFSIVVPADSDITTTEDLAGKVLGISDFGGGELPLVRAALSEAGLDEETDLEVLAVGDSPPAVLTALQNGDIDAYGSDWFVFFGLEQAGMEIREIIPDELSNLTAEVLVATPEYVADHPDVVEAVLRAMAKGSYFTHYDKDAALNILRERVPEEHENPDEAPLILDLFLTLANVPESGGVPQWGEQSLDAWETWKTVLGDVSDVADIDVSTIVNSTFVDTANDIDLSAIEEQADGLDLQYP